MIFYLEHYAFNTGPFMRGVLMHVHASTDAQKHLKCDNTHAQIKVLTADYVPILMLLLNSRLSLIIKLNLC